MEALIIDDEAVNLQVATATLNKLGVTAIQSICNVPLALEHLRAVAEGQVRMPDLVILDLAFNLDSGFEVLRYWKATPSLEKLRIFVWTRMGDLEKRISNLFGVCGVVDKRLGGAELERALRPVLTSAFTADEARLSRFFC